MKFSLLDAYCFSIGIAAIIGAVRFKKINPAYYPFIFLTWIAFLNEIITYFLVYAGHYTYVSYNLYVLLESLLLTWQFHKWGLFRGAKGFFYSILIFLVLFWFIEAFFIKGIKQNITWFRIVYSFIIVLMSLQVISNIITTNRGIILKNSIFLLCLSFIIYFTFKVMVGIFWLWGLKRNDEFVSNIGWILIYLNVFINLIYALAVLWMPRRLQFTLPS